MDFIKNEAIVYEKKSWSNPLKAGVLCTVGYFAVGAGILFAVSPPLEELLEENSKDLVSQIFQQQLNQNIKCEKVKILIKVSEGHFIGQAHLSDKSVRDITIKFDGQNLKVEIPAQQ